MAQDIALATSTGGCSSRQTSGVTARQTIRINDTITTSPSAGSGMGPVHHRVRAAAANTWALPRPRAAFAVPSELGLVAGQSAGETPGVPLGSQSTVSLNGPDKGSGTGAALARLESFSIEAMLQTAAHSIVPDREVNTQSLVPSGFLRWLILACRWRVNVPAAVISPRRMRRNDSNRKCHNRDRHRRESPNHSATPVAQ